MKTKVLMWALVGVLILGAGFGVLAREAVSEEELLFMEIPNVVTSTLTEIPLNKAPSTMSVISEDEIVKSGAKTLGELLKYVTNVELQHGNIMDYVISVRGLRSLKNNGKVLFLIDGHTMNSPQTGDWQAWGLAGIKQIEIIRGPGSALYGDHALTGVVNIITKKPADMKQSYIQVGGGYFNTSRRSLVLGSGNDSGGYRFIYEYFNTKGSKDSIIENDRAREVWDPRCADSTTPFYDPNYTPKSMCPGPGYEGKYFQIVDSRFDYKNYYVWSRWEDTRYEFIKSSDNTYLNSVASVGLENNLRIEGGGKFDLKDNGSFMAKAWHEILKDKTLRRDYCNGFTLNIDASDDGIIEQFPEGGRYIESITTKIDGIDVRYQATIRNVHNVLIGAARQQIGQNDRHVFRQSNFDDSAVGPTGLEFKDFSSAYPELKRDMTSGYCQYFGLLTKKLDIIMGGRYDDYSDFKSVFTPRAGIVVSPNKKIVGKLLYATAYRAPSLGEITYQPINVISAYNAYNVKPEKIQTIELNVTGSFEKTRGSLTLFKSNLRDVITITSRVAMLGSVSTNMDFYENGGNEEVMGTELELTHSLLDNLKLHFNHAWLFKAKDTTKDVNLYAQAPHKLHIGSQTGLFNKKVDWFLDAFYSSKRPRVPEHLNPNPEKAEVITQIDTSILFKEVVASNVDLSLSITNLLNNKYKVSDDLGAETRRFVPYDIPRPGIGCYANVVAKF